VLYNVRNKTLILKNLSDNFPLFHTGIIGVKFCVAVPVQMDMSHHWCKVMSGGTHCCRAVRDQE
jgi:hypothetical protein